VGPTPGKYRVSILDGGPAASDVGRAAPGAPPPVAAKPKVPEKYKARTTLRAEVRAGGPNTFDFELTGH